MNISKYFREDILMKRRAIAQKVGCNPETIRYYENIGLLASIQRDKNGYRIYSESDSNRLKFIIKCRKLGFSIDDISGLLSLTDQAETMNKCEKVQEITRDNLKSIRSKIEELQQMEKRLIKMSNKCDPESEPNCAILNELSTDNIIKIY